MNVWQYAIFRITILLVNILYPSISRRSVRFGVVVPPNKDGDPKLLAIVNGYRNVSGCIGGFFLIAEICFIQFNVISPLAALIYFFPLSQAANFAIYVSAHRKVNRLKKEQGWQLNKQRHIAVDLSTRNRVALSRWFYLLPILLLAINVIAIAQYYDRIPEQFPIHYTGGEVDRVAEKSIPIVFSPNMIQLGFVAIMIGVMEGIIRSKKQIYLPVSGGSDKRFLRRRHLLIAHAVTGIGLILFSVAQLSMFRFLTSNIGWTIEAANALILTIALLFGRSKNDRDRTNRYDPGAEWKLGMFYVNPHDPAIIVERLDGTGYTVNLGRIGGWAVVVSPLFFAGIMIWYSFL